MDAIVGTAVLCTKGPIQWLYYVRSVDKRGGELSCDELPMMPEGGPPPSEKLPSWFPENKPWKYRIEGDVLHCHPSVHIPEFFHNTGTWSINFILSTGETRIDHYRQLGAVNPDLDIQEKIDRVVEFSEG